MQTGLHQSAECQWSSAIRELPVSPRYCTYGSMKSDLKNAVISSRDMSTWKISTRSPDLRSHRFGDTVYFSQLQLCTQRLDVSEAISLMILRFPDDACDHFRGCKRVHCPIKPVVIQSRESFTVACPGGYARRGHAQRSSADRPPGQKQCCRHSRMHRRNGK